MNLRLIADAARNIGAQPIFLTQPHLPAADNSDEDKERIAYDMVRLSHDGLVSAFAACDAVTLAAGQEEGVPVLDLSKSLSGRSELFADYVHTTAAGSRAIASLTADFLEGILRAGNGGRR